MLASARKRTLTPSRADSRARAFVVIPYPGSVWGPQDPHFGETCILLRNILLGLGTVFPRGTWMISDVRDVARFHARFLRVRTHDRYFAPTTTVGVREVFSIIRDATRRSIPLLSVPEPLLRPGLLLGEAASRSLGLPMLWPAAAGWAVGLYSAADDSRTRREFGLDPTPLRDTVRDTVRWMASVGYVSARQAGALR